jgi:hypothetical protein
MKLIVFMEMSKTVAINTRRVFENDIKLADVAQIRHLRSI